MGYVTHVVRTDTAPSDGSTLVATLGLTAGATLISCGAVVALPSSSGWVPDTPSTNARIEWLGPTNVSSQNDMMTPSGAKAVARNVASGEALWLTMTELQ